MDAIPEIEKAVPGIAGKLLPPPYAAAGHSMGTYIAMLEAGLRTRNPLNGNIKDHPDARIGLVVMSSDPGKMALMPEELWRGIDVPTFMTTGSEDFGVSGKGRRASEYTTEVLPGAGGSRTASPQGDRYRVFIEGGNHYYGGLVHRDPGGLKPDYEALNIFNALSMAFLDAYQKKDSAAAEYLRRVDLKGITRNRATLACSRPLGSQPAGSGGDAEARLGNGLFQGGALNHGWIELHRDDAGGAVSFRLLYALMTGQRVLHAALASATRHSRNLDVDSLHVNYSLLANPGRQPRSRSELLTTLTLLIAIAAPAMAGLSSPNAASGRPIRL